MKWVLIVCGALGAVIVAGLLWSSDLGGRVLADSVLAALARGDPATVTARVRTADGSTLRVVVQDVDGVWKLHGPIEVVD